MRKKYAYLIITTSVLVVLIAVIFYRNFNDNKINFASSSISNTQKASPESGDLTKREKASDSYKLAQQENTARLDEKEENHSKPENILEPGLNRFVFDMSRELCKQERESLEEILESQDSRQRPRARELINLLRKTANSKCSSFRKTNAQELFFKFNLDEKNYKKFLQEFSLVLWDYQGTIPLKLMRASINELNHAKAEDRKHLRDAVLFALNNTINDSSAFIDIGVSVSILKELSEKGLISHPSFQEITGLDEEFRAAMKAQIRRNDEFRKNHDYPLDKIAYYLDYEDAIIELKLIREEYETVDRFRDRLSGFMKKSFK